MADPEEAREEATVAAAPSTLPDPEREGYGRLGGITWRIEVDDADDVRDDLGPTEWVPARLRHTAEVIVDADYRRPAPDPEPEACPYDPTTLAGQPIGMHHCPECGCMVIAGMAHPPCIDSGCEYEVSAPPGYYDALGPEPAPEPPVTICAQAPGGTPPSGPAPSAPAPAEDHWLDGIANMVARLHLAETERDQALADLEALREGVRVEAERARSFADAVSIPADRRYTLGDYADRLRALLPPPSPEPAEGDEG